MTWPMTGSVQSSVSEFLYWVALSGICWALYAASGLWLTITRHDWRNWKKRTSFSLDEWLADHLSWLMLPVTGRLIRLAMALVLFVLGYLTREMVMYNHTYVLHDVRVIRRDQPDMYLMVVNNLPFEMKFCPDYVPDLDPGMQLSLLIYEDRQSCKSVASSSLGFTVIRDATGKYIPFEEDN